MKNRSLVILSLALCYLLIPEILFSQVSRDDIADSSPVQITSIGTYNDPSGTQPIDVIEQSLFNQSNRSVIDFGFTNDATWLKIQVVNTSDSTTQKMLKVGKLLIDSVQIYFKEGDNWQTMITGAKVPNRYKAITGKSTYFPIELKGRDTIDYYVRSVSTYGIQFDVTIIDEKASISQDTSETLIQGFFLGALLVITLYNLFLGFSIRDSIYFHYAAANLMTILAGLSIRGFFSTYLPDKYVVSMPHIITGTTALYAVVSSNFNIRILNLRKYSMPAYYAMLSVAGIIFVLALGLSIARLNGAIVHNGPLAYTNMLFTITALAAGIAAYRNGSYYAKYYLLGWTLLLLSVLLYTLVILGFIERNLFTANLYLIGSVLEVILLSLALADRYNFLQKERIKLSKKVKSKDSDLAMVISDNRLRHQFKQELLEKMQQISRSDGDSIKSKMTSFINSLKIQLEVEDKHDYFQENIESINKEFESKLKERYPELSNLEIEICYLIMLKLSNKEIAEFRNTSLGSTKVARHRIRRKMELNEQSLDEVLLEIWSSK